MGLRGAISIIVVEGLLRWEPWRRTSSAGQTLVLDPQISDVSPGVELTVMLTVVMLEAMMEGATTLLPPCALKLGQKP